MGVTKGKLARKLAGKLTELGARTTDLAAKADVFIDLSSLAKDWQASQVRETFAAVREALAGGALTVEINPDETPLSRRVDLTLRGPAGQLLPALGRAAWPDAD